MPQRLEVGNIVVGAWESFRKDCITPAAGPTQVNEMQKAFYGGCVTILSAMASISERELPDEVGVLILESMWQEVRKFAADLPDNGPGGPTNEIWH